MDNPPETAGAAPIRILAPSSGIASLEAFLEEARPQIRSPFAEDRSAALDALSRALLSHPRLKRDPAGASLGFWLRRANVAALERDFRSQAVPGRRVPAGLVFHVAPANVDTVFIYSWAL